MTQGDLEGATLRHLKYTMGKTPSHATVFDWRMALSYAVRERIMDPWFASTQATYREQKKRVYYLSMEFLIGRLLEDAIVNLGLVDEARAVMARQGLDLHAVVATEPDAALGNGGLGRLAACFLDSLSTIGCPAMGYGIRYEHGLFRQRFVDGRQVEEPEDWLNQQHAWEFERPEATFEIGFGGHVEEVESRARWYPGERVIAQGWDTPVIGWQGRWANTLRLWGAMPVQLFDLASFNRGDYAAAAQPEALARTISRVLYPDDTTDQGKALRLKQEYFFTAASLRDILRRFRGEYHDLRKLPAKAAIQLNDTHPAIAGPELVRLLMDEHAIPFEDAADIAQRTLSYTNHTLLPEALERWSEHLMGSLLPRHMQIIGRIDELHASRHPDRRMAIRGDGQVRMGELSFVMAHKVNGVSALHTGLMKETVFAELHRLHPDRIVNQTNGVTPRRWVLSANPRLSKLISEAVGPGWEDDLERLAGLEAVIDGDGFASAFMAAKRANKVELSDWIAESLGIKLDPDAMFDVQIKRIHEYKRQHMNILQAIAEWQALRDAPGSAKVPKVRLFAGKAAPGYVLAKEIIRLINDAAEVINRDPVTRDWLKIVYLPNYNVSLAERLIPAADLSEQISTAGKEASGTGNMKFALNGAPTIGTLDGANVEIRERVGAENFFLFGMTAAEAMARREVPGHAAEAIGRSPALARALEAVESGMFSSDEPGRYHGLVGNIRHHDYFLVASDFDDYARAQTEAAAAFADRGEWARMAALNVARSGWFSSDRTIRGYMADVWAAQPLI
ncbi:MAG: glycogen/starch/alpha-glucan phosphorylase [Rhodobacteraceae bacterium]|jgi:starch phosphorylase|nr:glycogen/starch/alpha-glucan phosphorylase [Paracoccaceae bacterium]